MLYFASFPNQSVEDKFKFKKTGKKKLIKIKINKLQLTVIILNFLIVAI